MNQYRIYDKAMRVIASCLTAEHLPMCSAFTELALKRLEQIGTEFSREAFWDLRRRLTAKENELIPRRDRQMHGYDSVMLARMQQQLSDNANPLPQSLWPSL